MHTLIITSSVDQNVLLSVFTYQDKQYYSDCMETYDKSFVYFADPNTSEMHEVNPGSYHADSIAMTAGQELSVRVFSMFDFDDLLPHDWSLVALAD